MKKDIYLYVEWLSLREYCVRKEKTKREQTLHDYFKSVYKIRLFEANFKDVIKRLEEDK